MAKDGDRSVRYMKILGIGIRSIPVALMLFFMGILVYFVQSKIARDYIESTCRATTMKHEERPCRGSKFDRACVFVIWRVQHIGPELINATVEATYWATNKNEAMEAMDKYEVCIILR